MKILFVASECAPFAVSGGLGDVIGSLPKAISEIEKSADVSVILPYYDNIKNSYSNLSTKVCDLNFKLSWRSARASIYKINHNGINYFFVENSYYFDRGKLYGEYDDGERFAFFSMSVIEFMLKTGYIPNILHANDWQAALSVIYLKTKYKDFIELSQIKTLFTVHNIEYQGKFDRLILEDVFDINKDFANILEFDNNINLLKGALTISDYVSTVSPNYKEELRHNFFAFGLAPIINSIFYKMSGVINGIDYNVFSPETDTDIYMRYNRKNISKGKKTNKLALQKELGFPEKENIPLIVLITRLTEGKGIDLFLHIIEELLCEDIQIAVLGTGEEKYEDALLKLSEEKSNFVALIKFDRVLSKKMYAGADMFLMPSKSEPCGLAQMIACSYGTVPIVRSVGGLYDTIQNWDGKIGNGFRFDNYNAHELLYTIKKAISFYKNEAWHDIMLNSFDSKFTWNSSAAKYIEIYNNLLSW